MRRSVVSTMVLGGVWLLTLTADARAQQERVPQWGKPAPALSVELLQAPAGAQATWSALKGQAVIVEFWATWCPSCIEQIPHLNALVETFKDKPIRFISVTDEETAVVTAFLKKRPIAGWIGLDAGSATFNRYNIVGRPYTALIDANGVLRALLPPHDVHESTIRELLAGTLQPKQATRPTPVIGTEANRPQPLAQIIVRPAMPDTVTRMSPGATLLTGNRWEGWGLDVRALMSAAFGESELKIVVSDGVPTARYDVAIVLPDGTPARRNATLRHLLENVFQVNVRRAAREMDVFVLRARPDGVRFKADPNGRPLTDIASTAQNFLGSVVVDETGLVGTFDVTKLAWPKTKEELLAQLKGLGLSLTVERRTIDVLVAEPAKQ
jgi:thiol-disulfide isomerase/thioredoxin